MIVLVVLLRQCSERGRGSHRWDRSPACELLLSESELPTSCRHGGFGLFKLWRISVSRTGGGLRHSGAQSGYVGAIHESLLVPVFLIKGPNVVPTPIANRLLAAVRELIQYWPQGSARHEARESCVH